MEDYGEFSSLNLYDRLWNSRNENEYIREQLQIAQQQRIRQLQIEEQERIVEREELERIAEAQRLQLENEQLLAERIEDITENEIENRVLNIENAIFAQNLAQAIRRIMPYIVPWDQYQST